MAAPMEIVAAPLTVYLAPVGTAFPLVDTAPAVGWVKLGTSGDKNYSEDGVTVQHSQSIATFTPAGGTAPRKAWRTQEGLEIGFTLVDISAAQYAQVLNDASVTTTAPGVGQPGQDDFDLLQGLDVATFALIARGLSPSDEQFVAQYQVPIVYQGAEPTPAYKKGEPAGLACSFMALEDASLGFGKLIVQTAAAS